jgi:hypothetical protein
LSMDEKLFNSVLNGWKLLFQNSCSNDMHAQKGQEVMLGEHRVEDEREAQESLDVRLCELQVMKHLKILSTTIFLWWDDVVWWTIYYETKHVLIESVYYGSVNR